MTKKILFLIAFGFVITSTIHAQNLSTPDKANNIGNPALTNGVLNYSIGLFESVNQGSFCSCFNQLYCKWYYDRSNCFKYWTRLELQAGGSIVRELRGEPDDVRENGKMGWIR
ncbi:MAG: hypothetical protein U5Q03_18100 [Bacteroidota bacterium]|nr:hypothetical protein [Bacteroidota bacterium]